MPGIYFRIHRIGCMQVRENPNITTTCMTAYWLWRGLVSSQSVIVRIGHE